MTRDGSPQWLAVLGIGEDGVEGLSPAAQALLRGAAVVYGGRRHLALAAGLIGGEARAWASPMEDSYAALLAEAPRPVVVLASGDPFCFGVGSVLARLVPGLLCIPAPSAFALACARLGWAMQDCATVSFCGRPLAALRPLLQPGARILALSADAATPAAVAALLRDGGFGPTRMHVLEALGGANERIGSTTAAEFAATPGALNMLALEVVVAPGARVIPLAAGLPDAFFEHDGQITRSEIRAMTLAALAPRQGELLWDIGCGSGSVSIEWLLRHPANMAIGLERNAARAARAARNALALGVPRLQLVQAAAPGGLAGLPPPDAVFIGGGCDGAVLDAAWAALSPGGRLVANAVTVETEALFLARHAGFGARLTRIALSRMDAVGTRHGFRPGMAVTQFVAVKP
ncbi:precorrin-6y C5,15-methyltransferase (decarboxylating) subunit CbiE [Roseomonas haemaphysalidis]|uniref:Precorrin-6y C5,15-methyltransferase (Decarboxylating) subunit CbiE n=1 Tax=Roseomonas haemaphysalidis TaxID=2768162 RepID=A0ABS3KSY3_9PROT|nr:precorrin-6y C5,15-methyltransferase (decarboxylating) subunit CbiE [Roseomonas haemaphysalidis]MBO1080574.1 precorrin-6y C5,15-methyltransferase (decarboxylating) subunit CbiE [Roseomonas haemaphysalidis]